MLSTRYLKLTPGFCSQLDNNAMRGPALLLLLGCATLALAQNSTVSPVAPVTNADGSINISAQPGCGGTGAELSKGLSDCSFSGFLSFNSTKAFNFSTGGNSSYNVLFILRTLQGEATMGVYTPRDIASASSSPSIYGQMIYSTATAIESFLYIPAAMLAEKGTYSLAIRSTVTKPFYSLTVLTPSVNLTLSASNAAVLAQVHEACCPDSNDIGLYPGTSYCRSG